MAIEFRCGSCQKKLKVKDELGGKKIKCPACGKPIEVPEADGSAKPPPDPKLGSTASIINLNLDKFKHKEFDPEDSSDEIEGLEGAVVKRRQRLKAETAPPPSVPLQPVDWLICLLCNGFCLIYPIVLLARGEKSRGLKALGLSLAAIAFSIVVAVLQIIAAMMQTP